MALVGIDTTAWTYTHHCEWCPPEIADTTHSLAAGGKHTLIDTSQGHTPGLSALATICPNCGAIECYNTALTSADEAHPHPTRAQQAQLIRALMGHRGMARHP